MSAVRSKSFVTRFAGLALGAFVAACSGGGGGGGSSSFDDQAILLEVRFPDPAGVNPEDETSAPAAAPLVQQVVFVFDGRPDPNRVSRDSLQIRDAAGRPVPGRFVVQDSVVTFTPELPTSEAVQLAEGEFDTGGAGLEPGTSYTVRASPKIFAFIAAVDDELRSRFPDLTDAEGMVIPFTTTTVIGDFFRGFSAAPPRLLDVDPSDGSSDFSPGLYGDPDGLFPARRGLTLRFDGPVHPAQVNLSRFLLVDLDERPSSSPAGLPLGIDVQILRNQVDECSVLVSPSGILPFGHTLSLEHPVGLSGLGAVDPDPGAETTVASTFRVSEAPDTVVRDILSENFDTTDRQDRDPSAIEVGQRFAAWDDLDSDVLEATFAFSGGGVLGRFAPAPPAAGETRIVALDTSSQTFPLLDGSTPDAPPGFVATGGIFPFTDIDIPAGVDIDVRGPNPLVFSATGSVRIAGRILANGQAGTDENAFDSAVTSVPGGAGRASGGRGGEGHPILYFPPDVISNRTLVSPIRGGRGFGAANSGRIGGVGGESGVIDLPDAEGNYGTDSEIDCSELVSAHNNGYKPPGGGGGSMLLEGSEPRRHGEGNVLADGIGGYIVRTRETDGNRFDRLDRGPAGVTPFKDGDPNNDFFGLLGEIQDVHGGQGGGGGGSALDGYFCGDWCFLDADPTNDALCQSEFGGAPAFSSSVGDSRGGSAGGGGGAVVIMALGEIVVSASAEINCSGGRGGGGEMLGCGAWSGGGGGGSGGAIVMQSATDITVRSGAGVRVDGGLGALATAEKTYNGGSCPGARRDNTPGAGGDGAIGLIQLQLARGQRANVENSSNLTAGSWVDPDNQQNPAPFGSVSVALSEWYDMGRVIARPPADTNPIYGFQGLAADGTVPTDASGNVLNPGALDIRCDYLGQLDPLNPGQYLPGQQPRSNFIPPNASVTVHFQGADAITDGSKEIDPGSLSAWSPDIADANGKQFVRYRITFDLAADAGTVGPDTPRPAVQSIRLRAEF